MGKIGALVTTVDPLVVVVGEGALPTRRGNRAPTGNADRDRDDSLLELAVGRAEE
jgi:hypothetical protein